MIRLRGHTKAVTALAFTPDGRHLASASKDYSLRLWELPAGTGRVLFQGGTELFEEDTGLAVSPDGRWLASTSVRHGLRVWDVATGKRKRRLVNTPNWVYDRHLAFDPVRPRLLATDWMARRRTGDSKRVRAWDTDTWAELDPLVPPTDAAVDPLVFAPDGRRLLAGRRVLHPVTGAVTADLKTACELHTGGSAVWLPGGTRFAIAEWRDTIRVIDGAAGTLVSVLPGNRKEWKAVAATPDGRRLLTARTDGTVTAWDTGTWKEAARYDWKVRRATALAISADGTLAAVGGGSGPIVVWDLE